MTWKQRYAAADAAAVIPSRAKRMSGEFAALTLAEAEEMLLELREQAEKNNQSTSPAEGSTTTCAPISNRASTPVPGITRDEVGLYRWRHARSIDMHLCLIETRLC